MTILKMVLDFLYSEERNVQVQSFLDTGWTITLGDPQNGFSDTIRVQCSGLEFGAMWFLSLYLAHEGAIARARWESFRQRLEKKDEQSKRVA